MRRRCGGRAGVRRAGSVRRGRKQVPERIDAHAEWRVRLDVHALDAAPVRELVHEERRQFHLNRVVDIRQRQSHGLRLRAVHRDVQLLRARQRIGADAVEIGALAGFLEQCFLGGLQLVTRLPASRLQVHVDAAKLAQSADRRQIGREDLRLGDAMQDLVDLRNQRHRALRSLAPVGQLDERHADVLARADEAEADRLKHGIDVLPDRAVEKLVADFAHDASRAGERRSRRQVHEHEDEALILVRHEACWQLRVQEARQHDEQHEAHHPSRRMTDGAADVANVGARHPPETAIEPAEDQSFIVGVDRPQDGGAQRRRERHGQERGEDHRHGDGQCKLGVDDARRAWLQRGRYEHR
ncbi:hypothetical protein D3C86_1290850 [compost metagenome]